MFIFSDVNERATNPRVVERLKKVFPNLKDDEQLPFGDVNVVLDNGSLLAIERKRAADFLGSIADGRVFRQVEAMSNGAKWCCVIIEGHFAYDQNDMVVVDGELTNWRGKSVRNAMLAIQYSGCPIVFTTREGYPYAVADMIEFCSKPDKHYQGLGHKRIVTFPPVELKEEIIAAFPGVGPKRATALFEFVKGKGSNATLAEALCWVSSFPLIAENARPEGWGNKTVENFRVALGHTAWEFLDLKEDNKIKEGVLVKEAKHKSTVHKVEKKKKK